MARMRFEIESEPTGVSLPTYSSATYKLLQLLKEIDSAISGKFGGMVNWYIIDAKKNGTLALALESRVKPEARHPKVRHYDTAPKVAQSLVIGFENIEQRGISPPYLSELGIEKLSGMMDLLRKDGAKSFIATFIDDNRSISVTTKAAETLRELLPPRRKELSSVEGKLETISIHKTKKFIIYESISGKGVTCILRKEDLFAQAMEALGQKVAVSGEVSFNIKNEPCMVTVDVLRPLGKGELPTARELLGSDPDFTGDLSTDEYIREIRRG